MRKVKVQFEVNILLPDEQGVNTPYSIGQTETFSESHFPLVSRWVRVLEWIEEKKKKARDILDEEMEEEIKEIEDIKKMTESPKNKMASSKKGK